MTSYTPLARCLAFVLSLAILHPHGLLAQVNVTTQGGAGAAFNGGAVSGATTFLDGANFGILNTADPTKIIRFDASGITTGTARTYTMPNVSSTIAVLGLAQTWVGLQTFGAITATADITLPNNGGLLFGSTGMYALTATVQTPDTVVFGTSTASNSMVIAERADGTGFDFAHALQTNPTLYGHSANASTTEWWGLTHDQTNGVLSTGVGALKISSAKGMILSTGSAPTVTACGTSPSAVAGSNTAGRLTTGSGGTVQSCTLTFVPALAAAPSCVANDETAILLVRATATTTTLVIDSAVAGSLASQVLTYICIGGV